MIRASLLLVLLLFSTKLAIAFDDKIDAKLLIGKWEYEKLPYGLMITVEFTKDNKIKYVAGAQGKTEKLEGTYKVEGNMLTIQINKDNKETTKTVKIIKLSEKACTTKDDERDGEESNMKKVP